MKCPVCSEKNLKSCVYIGVSTSTLMYCPPYYDEDGKYHSHDSNTHSTNYNCSNGHTWIESSTGICPSCDFGKDSNEIRILNDKEIYSDNTTITSPSTTENMTISATPLSLTSEMLDSLTLKSIQK